MGTLRIVFIAAAAILVALVAWWIIGFVTSLLFTIVKVAFLAGVVYVLYLIVRSSVRDRSDRGKRAAS